MPDLPLPARFVDGELLGRGPGTEVYRAHDQVLDRPVAVKMFAADADPQTRERIDREGQALGRLAHPGLVTVYDCGTYESRPYLVTRLIAGRTLQARLTEGPLPVPMVLDLGARLADALAHVHGRGVVHRDVKPANVFLDETGQPFLGDFGIALLTGQTRLTSYQEIIGTPAYLAPEQVRGVEVGPAADVYALGLVLIECLTGEVEYAAPSKAEAALARLSRAPRLPTGIPDRLADLLRAMTDDQPGRRPTALRCADELTALAAGETRPLPAPRNAHRRGLALAAGACVATAAVAGLLTVLIPTTPAQRPGFSAPAEATSPQATTGPAAPIPVVHPIADAAPVTTHGPTSPASQPLPASQPPSSSSPQGHHKKPDKHKHQG
ncbi:MAG TPA: protein kinase [Pseudonocardiaceae bacterium]